MHETSNRYRIFGICIVLTLATLAVYWQVRNHEFISLDDDLYILDNSHVKAGLTREGLIWAFTEVHAYNWHPLTWISHMLDCQLCGLDPGRHHLINVLFHVANTILLLLVLNRMTGNLWASAFVAAAFALHPLHAESVAWASERKDVLSTFFWILIMWVYVRYVEHPTVKRYLVIFLLFALGLMAKQMLVTLPFVLLLLDYWPLRRLTFKAQSLHNSTLTVAPVSTRRCILEKLPLLILSVAAGTVVYLIQRRTGLVRFGTDYPLLSRIANALIAYVAYIKKMLWPSDLAFFYPYQHGDLLSFSLIASSLLLVCITVVVIYKIRQHPYLAVGWFWYLGTLLPVIGLVQLVDQAMADRYSYMTLTGLFIIIAWGTPELFARLHYRKAVLSVSAAVLFLILGVTTWCQVKHWRSSMSLYSHGTIVVQNNWWCHNALGQTFALQGNSDDAFKHFTEALRIKPRYAEAHNKLGLLFVQQDKLDEAIKHYTKALEIKPSFAGAHNDLGVALGRQGKLEQAITHFTEALRIQPDFAKAHSNIGHALARRGKLDQAVTHYTEALRIKPDFAKAQSNLANALLRQGKFDQAITHFTEALRIKPDFAEAHNDLGAALARQGRLDEAIMHFTEALRIKPDFAEAQRNLDAILTWRDKLDKAAQPSIDPSP